MSMSKVDFRRFCLPYGVWTCADGRQVLFNRSYVPIYQMYPGQKPTQADPNEWVKNIITESWFYNDGTSEANAYRAGLDALEQWGIDPAVFKVKLEGVMQKGRT